MNKKIVTMLALAVLTSAAPGWAADQDKTKEQPGRQPKRIEAQPTSAWKKDHIYEKRKQARQRLDKALAEGLGPKKPPKTREGLK